MIRKICSRAQLHQSKKIRKELFLIKRTSNRSKALKKCVSCDADVPSGSQFCPKCGAKVEDDDVVADVEAVVIDDDMVEDEDIVADEAPAEEAPAEDAAEAEETADADEE